MHEHIILALQAKYKATLISYSCQKAIPMGGGDGPAVKAPLRYYVLHDSVVSVSYFKGHIPEISTERRSTNRNHAELVLASIDGGSALPDS